MSSQFHHRLVGTVVFVALGVIFLPDILDGKKERQQESFSEIPLRPQVPSRSLAEQSVSSLTTDSAETTAYEGVNDPVVVATEASIQTRSVDQQQAQSSSPDDTILEATPQQQSKSGNRAATATSSAVGWTLQLGSFNNASNVKALVSQLRNAGIAAYTLPATPVDGQLTKVFVGPDVSADKLKARQKQVEQLTQLTGRIVAYNPQQK